MIQLNERVMRVMFDGSDDGVRVSSTTVTIDLLFGLKNGDKVSCVSLRHTKIFSLLSQRKIAENVHI